MSEALTLDQVRKVSLLARLDLSENEMDRMRDHLNDIIVQFERLQDLDTTKIEPTSHTLQLTNVFREDVARPSLPRDAATANAPEKRDGNFIVPQIVEL